MAIESSYQVKDASGDVLTLRGYAVGGVQAPAPFVPEIGEAADAAWTGTGTASVIAALKALALRLGGAADMASGKSPVTGTFTATGASTSFTPVAGRGFNASLWGTFSGSVRLERSFDAGTTWLPLTAAGNALYVFTAAGSEVAEEPETGVLYRLSCTAFSSGTINYRISQ